MTSSWSARCIPAARGRQGRPAATQHRQHDAIGGATRKAISIRSRWDPADRDDKQQDRLTFHIAWRAPCCFWTVVNSNPVLGGMNG
jgi:hypothetical protein